MAGGFVFFQAVGVPAQSGQCSVGDVSFACPKGYEIRNARGTSEPFLAFNPKHKFAVFGLASNGTGAGEELVKQALERSFKSLFNINYGELSTKKSDDFWSDEKWSKFEVSKFAKASLAKDANLGLHYQFILLKFKGNQIILGYVYDAAPPRPAETWYQTWSGGGFGDASSGLQDLILAITREKRPTSTPGGPPPGLVE